MFRYSFFGLVAALLAAILMAPAALAANPHFVVSPTFTVNDNGTVTGTQTDIEVENGRASFDVTTAAPVLDPTLTPKQLGCPNNKWTPEIGEVTVVSATLQIIQPAGSGNVVLEETFTS